jgi:hypothetical protein
MNNDQRISEEQAYAAIADELNDSPGSYEVYGGTKPTVDDFNDEIVARAAKYAAENSLPWPPDTGDFDRYWERKRR